MENLKLCPFCGTKAKIAKTHVRFKKGKTKKIKKTAYAIGCSDPECILYNSGTFSSLYFTVSADSLEYMKRKWNRRTDNNGYTLSVSTYIYHEPEREKIDPAQIKTDADNAFLQSIRTTLDFEKAVAEIEGGSILPLITRIKAVLAEYETAAMMEG